MTESGAHIAQSGYRSAQSGFDVDTLNQQNDGTKEEKQEIDKDEGDMLINTAGGNGFPVDFHRQHSIGMDDALQFQDGVLDEDEVTEHLHAP